MLKGIPNCISPELLCILMQMGHGDELVLADGNFPSASVARHLVRADGLNVPILLDAILQFLPLDGFVPLPVGLMAIVPGHEYHQPDIWSTYLEIIRKHEPRFQEFEYLERFDFYERAKLAYAVVATSELTLYANIILKKGIVSG
jgi:L-fucose mutarotase